MSARSPNFMLRSSHRVNHDGDYIDLPAGTFIRPIWIGNVPKHIKENPANKFFNPDIETYCYTRYGIIPIPNNCIMEV